VNIASKMLRQGWLLVALLLLWWFGSASSTSLFFPSLSAILQAFADTWLFERWGSDVVPSVVRFGIGYVLAVVIGIVAGIGIGYSWVLRGGTMWLVAFFQSLPGVALIPMMLMIFGIGDGMKIAIIAFGSLWPVLLNTVDGIRSVDGELREVARSYRFGGRRRLFDVMLPSAGPQIFAGMRTSLAISLILMVTSEMVASTNGIGYFVLQAQQTFAIPEMWSGIVLLGVLGYLSNAVFVLIESRVLAWHRGKQGAIS